MLRFSLMKVAIVDILIAVLASALATAQSPRPLASSTQLLVVTTADWSAVQGVLQRYERSQPGEEWRMVGSPIDVVVGKSGLGWGTGVVPVSAHGLDPVKREGDRKSPAGVFRLSTAFGYASQPLAGWKMPYVSLTPSVECVDDTHSKFYNRVVDRGAVSADWNSSEKMLSVGDSYRWGIVVDNNTEPVVPGNGSCVFMHIWRSREIGTVGCTAMPQKELETVLGWLDPAEKPLLVQLPLAKYRSLEKSWALPNLPKRDR
jgi:L,D-peptidoglycan transpeptidase YkuD (ErfK/YbiS/YcfS/YnhG family)